jgi:hypothetical protein
LCFACSFASLTLNIESVSNAIDNFLCFLWIILAIFCLISGVIFGDES